MFYKYTIDITCITKSGRKKNKRALTWVCPKHKKGVLTLFWHFCASLAIVSVYPNKIPTQLPGTLTHPLAQSVLASGSPGPNSSLQQPPLSDRHLSLTVANSSLLTALGPYFSSFSSGLVGNLSRKPFLWVSRRRNPLTGVHPHPHLQNECPLLCHTIFLSSTNKVWFVFFV